MKYTASPMTKWTPPLIVLDLIQLGLISIIIGVVVSATGAYVLKRFRFLTENPIIEVSIVFIFGYMAYGFSEVFKHSGIISVLTAGILLSHYSWYNLSPQAKTASSIAFQVAGYIMEAFVFSYLGLTIFSYLEQDWSWKFSIVMVFVLFFGRYIATIGIVKILDLFGFNSQIPLKELIFIGYGGMIRGAVSFACVLRLDHNLPHRSVIVTTALAMVSFTTVAQGATVATL